MKAVIDLADCTDGSDNSWPFTWLDCNTRELGSSALMLALAALRSACFISLGIMVVCARWQVSELEIVSGRLCIEDVADIVIALALHV